MRGISGAPKSRQLCTYLLPNGLSWSLESILGDLLFFCRRPRLLCLGLLPEFNPITATFGKLELSRELLSVNALLLIKKY